MKLNNKFLAETFIVLFFVGLISFVPMNLAPVYATNEGTLLPLMRFKSRAFISDLADFNISYPPHYFNVSQHMETDFAFPNTLYPGVNIGFNGTMYAYEHTFDIKYIASSATFYVYGLGEFLEGAVYFQYTSGNFYCRISTYIWGATDGFMDLPLRTWVSVSEKVLFNPNATPTIMYVNLTIYDYGFVDVSSHIINTIQTYNTGGTFSGLLRTQDEDDGGYLILEIKNQNWYQPYLGKIELSLSADLEEIDGGFVPRWVFTNWKYYTFTLRAELPDYGISIVDCGINFTVPCETVGVVSAYFIATNDTDGNFGWQYFSNLSSSDATRFGEPFLMKTGEVTEINLLTYNITFPIYFQKQCLDEWLTGTSVYGAANGTLDNASQSWEELQHKYFCIYSRGGFSLNYKSTSSEAYLMSGGTPFSFYATNGTSVYNEVWYRDVQHIKLLPDISFLTGKETFELRYGIDYVVQGNSSWQSGWYVQITAGTVSYTGIFAGNVWINMTVNFENRNGAFANYPYSNVYMFYHGSVSGVGDPGHFKVWFDLWFSDTNASSTGAARINGYEFPMCDNADLWLRWLANNWGVKDDVKKEAQGEFPLLDVDGVTPVSAGRIKMMRIWSNLTVEDANADQQITIGSFDTFDLTHSKELPLTGIPAPVFDETRMPSVGQSGILGAVFSLFSGIGQWLSENLIFGGLNLWGNFVNFLDTIAGMLGAPHFFSNLFSWIGQSVGYVGNAVGYVFTVIYDIFLLLGSVMVGFLSTIGTLIGSIVNTINFLTNIMGGVVGGAGNLWDQLGISNWIVVACVFYPIYLIILWEEKGTDAVVSQLTMIFGILSWFFNFFYQLATMLINFVSGLVESIPVVE